MTGHTDQYPRLLILLSSFVSADGWTDSRRDGQMDDIIFLVCDAMWSMKECERGAKLAPQPV